MKSRDIRNAFSAFFESKQHLKVPSSSLIPHNDPTVLLTTAGMQQMTPYFLGLESPPSTRMTTIQKCFRAVGKDDDVMEVGDDTHLTFFEMLGNFSVGEYFKDRAIDYAWEFMTEILKIDPGALWITVHPDDDFSRDYWRDTIGIPERKIQDDPDNIWGPVADTGPCGPNSELHFDRFYRQRGDDGRGPMSADEARYVEVWNLVFMEFNQEPDGNWSQLERQNVDTGMGLERLAMSLQETRSIYETDLFMPIIERAAELAGIHYGDESTADAALRIIGDHSRGTTFLITDGVLPGNEGRGYVLRRVMRRAIQKAKTIGIEGQFLGELADVVIEHFSEEYPDLSARQAQIQRVIKHEEEAFGRTLANGLSRFETLLAALADENVNIVPGQEAFRLHDTYGFPIDLTVELASLAGLEVDLDGFRAALAEQRERSRAEIDSFADASRARAPLYASLRDEHSQFVGYDTTQADTTVVVIISSDANQESADAGQSAELVLSVTPFYGESGGQVGDTGVIHTSTGSFQVEDTQRPTPDLIVHLGEVSEGFISMGQQAHAEVDLSRRLDIRRNHTATHLLHKALRTVLGDDTHQAGSLVAPDRLRFDFTSRQALGMGGQERITALVNAEILANKPVQILQESYDDARARGAMALFGEKYGDRVRVVEVPGYSIELCGGTHVASTGEIGPVVVLSESSIGSGVRRIEALSGRSALEYLARLHRTVKEISAELRVPEIDIQGEVQALQERLRASEREVEVLRMQLATANIDSLLDRQQQVDDIAVLAARVEALDRNTLLHVGDRLRDRLHSGVIVLASEIDEQPALIALVTKDQTARGLHAGRIIQAIAPIVNGRGGGRPELAQGGGNDASKLDEALAAVPAVVSQQAAG